MPVYEAEAIVLRQYPLSDSDRIIILATRESGKIRAAAQGVKKPKSAYGACLEPLSHLRLEYYAREGRDLVQIRHAELIRSYLGKKLSLEKMCVFNYFAEIINELVQDNQSNPALFRLLLSSLNAGEGCVSIPALVRYFEVWCLKLNGLFPNYAYCSNCGKCVKEEGFFAWLDAGQSRCSDCAQGRGIRIGKSATAALDEMVKLSPRQFGSQSLTREAAHELELLSQKLLEMNLERRLKSYRILAETLQGL